jgi:hypothetical protein
MKKLCNLQELKSMYIATTGNRQASHLDYWKKSYEDSRPSPQISNHGEHVYSSSSDIWAMLIPSGSMLVPGGRGSCSTSSYSSSSSDMT